MPGRCGFVLVVDDDPACRALVGEALRRAGHEVREAATGDEALGAASDARPLLVLLDVHLPGLTGYQVLRRLRTEFDDELPIIFISGERVEAYDRVGGLLLGADDYIVKPFDADELVARVERFLERTRPAFQRSMEEADSFGLTQREQEILALLALGRTASEIGDDLFISKKTVSAHIQNILSKLDVHTQAQAVALAFRSKLVSSDGELSSLRDRRRRGVRAPGA
jgi:DNA-binding NarL/FixJ family response regulator